MHTLVSNYTNINLIDDYDCLVVNGNMRDASKNLL